MSVETVPDVFSRMLLRSDVSWNYWDRFLQLHFDMKSFMLCPYSQTACPLSTSNWKCPKQVVVGWEGAAESWRGARLVFRIFIIMEEEQTLKMKNSTPLAVTGHDESVPPSTYSPLSANRLVLH